MQRLIICKVNPNDQEEKISNFSQNFSMSYFFRLPGLLLSLQPSWLFLLQGIEYQAAMECLQKADRRSLLAEIQALHSQMSIKKTTLKREQEIDQPSQGML